MKKTAKFQSTTTSYARLRGWLALVVTALKSFQRPTFARIGDDNTFVASDSSCVKIFDLRSGKAEMTIRQRVINSTPVYLNEFE